MTGIGGAVVGTVEVDLLVNGSTMLSLAKPYPTRNVNCDRKGVAIMRNCDA
jgi:hypothetical protein